MGLLNEIFSNVVFSEIDPLFDEMEKSIYVAYGRLRIEYARRSYIQWNLLPKYELPYFIWEIGEVGLSAGKPMQGSCLDTMRSNLRMYKHDVAELA